MVVVAAFVVVIVVVIVVVVVVVVVVVCDACRDAVVAFRRGRVLCAPGLLNISMLMRFVLDLEPWAEAPPRSCDPSKKMCPQPGFQGRGS